MARHYRRYSDEQVKEAIKNSFSWRETAFKVGLNGDAGSNYQTLKRIAKENNFDYSHFKGRGWNLGNEPINIIPLKDILKKGTYYKSWVLKKRLVKKGIFEDKCFICGQLPMWNGKPLVLELDHIDGDKTNNELSNIRILCGHCHSQTPNFRGRKLKKNKVKKETKIYCKNCKKEIGCKTKTGLCRKCFLDKDLHKKIQNRPSKNKLLKEIKESNYCKVGKKYNVSDNTIRKWIQ
jgi:hypothetical protein